jgi:RNA polymerase sigma-70 factor, ECF subfamily
MTLCLAFRRPDSQTMNGASLPTDDELVRRARSGDVEAFGDLVARKMSKVVAVARRILGDEEDAKDIGQLAFIRAWENLDRYDDTYAFSTWLYRIVTNLAIDSLRSRGTRERTAQGYLHVVRLREEREGSGVDRELERQEVERIFERVAGVLTERQRAVFVLKEIEELDSKEIAAILDCGESTVRNHLFNARRLLRRELVRLFPEYAGCLGEAEAAPESGGGK